MLKNIEGVDFMVKYKQLHKLKKEQRQRLAHLFEKAPSRIELFCLLKAIFKKQKRFPFITLSKLVFSNYNNLRNRLRFFQRIGLIRITTKQDSDISNIPHQNCNIFIELCDSDRLHDLFLLLKSKKIISFDEYRYYFQSILAHKDVLNEKGFGFLYIDNKDMPEDVLKEQGHFFLDEKKKKKRKQ